MFEKIDGQRFRQITHAIQEQIRAPQYGRIRNIIAIS